MYDGNKWVYNAGSVNFPNIIPAGFGMGDTLGCSCDDMLLCKPGNNVGEVKFGCTGSPDGLGTSGTVGLFISQQSWAKDEACFISNALTGNSIFSSYEEDSVTTLGFLVFIVLALFFAVRKTWYSF